EGTGKALAGRDGPAGCGAIDDLCGTASASGKQPGQYSPERDEHLAGRIIWVAHYLEHPRAEGLHILAEQPDFAAFARRVLGGNGGCDDGGDRALVEGNFGGGGRLEEGAASAGGLQGIQS